MAHTHYVMYLLTLHTILLLFIFYTIIQPTYLSVMCYYNEGTEHKTPLQHIPCYNSICNICKEI